jgi:hypothetical protein
MVASITCTIASVSHKLGPHVEELPCGVIRTPERLSKWELSIFFEIRGESNGLALALLKVVPAKYPRLGVATRLM